MTPKQIDDLREIRRLLREAYDDYFKRGDGSCKSSEGYVEVYYPNYFDGSADADMIPCGLGIYSYVLGPSRMNYWSSDETIDPFGMALTEVRKWHAEQLASDTDR